VMAAVAMVEAQLASAPSLIVTLKLLVAAHVPEDRCRRHHYLFAPWQHSHSDASRKYQLCS
jgi:hypothetical protein